MRAVGGELRPVDDVAAVGLGSVTSPCVSVSEDRGLANWPAMRPIFTTGSEAPKVSTTAICSSTRNVSRMMLAVKSRKALGAVAALQHERLALGRLREMRLQPPRLAGEHQRRIFADAAPPSPRAFPGPGRPAPGGSGMSRQESGVQARAGMVSGMAGLLGRRYSRPISVIASAAKQSRR